MDTSIGKADVMNDKGGLAIYFEAAASYLKNYLTKGRTSCMDIFTINTDKVSKIKSRFRLTRFPH